MLVIKLFWIAQQSSILEYLNVDGGVNFWEIIDIRPDTAEKYLTNILSFC